MKTDETVSVDSGWEVEEETELILRHGSASVQDQTNITELLLC